MQIVLAIKRIAPSCDLLPAQKRREISAFVLKMRQGLLARVPAIFLLRGAADARATDLSLGLFSSPTAREGRDFDGILRRQPANVDFQISLMLKNGHSH